MKTKKIDEAEKRHWQMNRYTPIEIDGVKYRPVFISWPTAQVADEGMEYISQFVFGVQFEEAKYDKSGASVAAPRAFRMIVSGNGPASSRHGRGPEVRFQKYEGEIGHEILKGSQPEGFPSMNDQEKCQDLAIKILSSIKDSVSGAAEDISKTLEDFDETAKWCGTFKRDEAFREGMLDGLMLFQKLAKKAGVKVSLLQRMKRAVDQAATKLIGKWNRDEFFSE